MNKNLFEKLKTQHSEKIFFLQKKYREDFGENIWKTAEIKKSIKNNIFQGDVLIASQRIGGFCLFKKIDNYVEIYSLFVDPKLRKKGIARFFIKKCIEYCYKNNLKKIILDVNETNSKAIEFYKRNNFIFCGKRKNYYRSEEVFNDALTMHLVL